MTIPEAPAEILSLLRQQRINTAGAVRELLRGRLDSQLSSAERVNLEGLFTDLDTLDARIESTTRMAMSLAHARGDGGMVYERGSEHSWLVDRINVARNSDPSSASAVRLRQHAEEVRAEARRFELERESRFTRAAAEGKWSVERRALSTTAGAGGEFAPPLWAIEDWGHLPRSAAPLTSLSRVMPLPKGVVSISVPRIASDPGTAIGTAQNTNITDDSTATTSSSTSVVQTISARVRISQQELDQANHGGAGGFDEVLFAQLQDDFAGNLEAQLIAGAGSGSGQLSGLLNISGLQTITYTSGSPTGAGLQQAVAQAASQVATNRLRAPGVALMAGRRWFWLSSQQDSQARPLGVIGTGTAVDPTGSDAGPFGPVHGLPVFLDGAIPLNQGAGTNQDVVIVTRPRDLLVWTGAPSLSVMPQTYADSLGVLVVFHALVAAVVDIYPTATAVVAGTGLVGPTGF